MTEVALFGSVLREHFRPDSDVDVQVTFAPEARLILSNFILMWVELERRFGREE